MKKWIVFGSIVFACSLCLVLYFIMECRGNVLSLTAKTKLYIPIDNKHDEQKDNGYMLYTIIPNSNARISEDPNDYESAEAIFKKGVLEIDFDYGPKYIKGSFPLSEIKAHWDSIPIEKDWPFNIYLFNTNSGRTFQAYMTLEVYSDRAEATATLIVYYKNEETEIKHWSGRIGEEIKFVCEL